MEPNLTHLAAAFGEAIAPRGEERKVSMAAEKTVVREFTVGWYVCPQTKATVPLRMSHSLAQTEWPVVVERCQDCGRRHVLCSEDVAHPPVYGYE